MVTSRIFFIHLSTGLQCAGTPMNIFPMCTGSSLPHLSTIPSLPQGRLHRACTSRHDRVGTYSGTRSISWSKLSQGPPSFARTSHRPSAYCCTASHLWAVLMHSAAPIRKSKLGNSSPWRRCYAHPSPHTDAPSCLVPWKA